MQRYGLIGLTDVDTRALTKHLRDTGSLRGVISTRDLDPEKSAIAKSAGLPEHVWRGSWPESSRAINPICGLVKAAAGFVKILKALHSWPLANSSGLLSWILASSTTRYGVSRNGAVR